jgi:addiction module HigA family antidote
MADDKVPAKIFPPGKYIREELEKRGWDQRDLAEILGRPQGAISQIVLGKRGITSKTAQELAAAFGTSAQYWLALESAYRLSLLPHTKTPPRQRGRSLVRVNSQLREALQGLYERQDGPPLVDEKTEWNAAMDKARAALDLAAPAPAGEGRTTNASTY